MLTCGMKPESTLLEHLVLRGNKHKIDKDLASINTDKIFFKRRE